MLTHNDWLTYSYNGIIDGVKTSENDTFKLHVKENNEIRPYSYIDAIYNNARRLEERFPQTKDVLLSGGVDSEVIVRVNHQLGIKQNIYTFRLEGGLNAQDVVWAQKLCTDLGIKLNIIDFSVKKFLETDAEDLYKKTFLYLPYLIRCKWFDYIDNIPVVANCEQYLKRGKGTDYKSKSTWFYKLIDAEFSYSVYAKHTHRLIVGEWYLYTPELMYSYHKHPVIRPLIKDRLHGKASSWSSRHNVFVEAWPDMEFKPKLTGYDGLGVAGSRPDYMIAFEKEIIGKSNLVDIAIPDYQIDAFVEGRLEEIEPLNREENPYIIR